MKSNTDKELPQKLRIPTRGGGYDAIHKWLVQHYGKANRCDSVKCKGSGKRYEWAKLKDKEYTHNRENFIKLCSSCHRLYDTKLDTAEKRARALQKRTNREICTNGHKRTEDNTKEVQRVYTKSLVCLVCLKESKRRNQWNRKQIATN